MRKIFKNVVCIALSIAMTVSVGSNVSAAEKGAEEEIKLSGVEYLDTTSDRTILPTDVSTASSGCTILGIEGSYIVEAENALKRINEIRKEACDEGVINPSTGKALTSKDYVPIKWSSDLEYIARIRAAESCLTMGHVRTNGSRCFAIKSPNGYSSNGEVIAWNWSTGMLKGIEQWYGEKSDWVNNVSGAVTGHYTQMIDPSHTYIGLATFYSPNAGYRNTTVGEYTGGSGFDETVGAEVKDCIQLLEVDNSYTNGAYELYSDLESTSLKKGDEVNLSVRTGWENNSDTANLIVFGVNWTSTDSSVASVDDNGKVAVKSCGKAKITASYGDFFSESYVISIAHNVENVPAVSATISTPGKTAGSHCADCKTVITSQKTIASPKTVTLSAKTYKYNGKVQKPTVVVKDTNGKVISSSNYSVKYVGNCKNGGTYKVQVIFKGNYSGKITKTFTIKSIGQSMRAKVTTKKYKASAIKKKARTFSISAKAKTKLTYKSEKKKYVKVSSKGKVTIKKGTPKGTYKIIVKAAKTANYKMATKTIKVIIK